MKMTLRGFELPETFLKIVKTNRDYSIFLLQGEELVFFPA